MSPYELAKSYDVVSIFKTGTDRTRFTFKTMGDAGDFSESLSGLFSNRILSTIKTTDLAITVIWV
jgi:hypothetical protein